MSERRGYKPPYVYRLIRDASGQTETVGMILILGLVVIGTTAVVAFGSTAITSLEESSNTQRTSHVMTQLDSQTAMVALGSSPQQSIDLSNAGGSGKYQVKESQGRIKVTHVNHTNKGHNETLYNETIGALVYESDKSTIIYQGGGVWRRTENGSAVMVSPPEFHYRSDTLTLPIIRVKGSGSALGATGVTVKKSGRTEHVFRDPSKTYSSNASKRYTNPIENGSIEIVVDTEYSKAWAEYFRTRTEGAVNVRSDGSVRVLLQTLGVNGEFGELPAPGSGDSIKIQGMSSHQVENLTINFDLDKAAAGPSMKFFLYSVSGNSEWAVAFKPNQGTSPHSMDVAMYFDRDKSDGLYQMWEKQAAFDLSGSHPKHTKFTANLTSTTKNMTYGTVSNYNWGQINDADFDGPSGSLRGSVYHDEHPTLGTPPEPTLYTSGNETTMNYLTNHYFALLAPNFEIETGAKGGGCGGAGNCNTVEYTKTTGNLSYTAGEASFIKFLHITENDVEFDFEE
jgi:hypothetical protein